jgi:hypothetical protein
MYIEFNLSSGHAATVIDDHLRAWSEQYKILYKTKVVKYKKRVTFENDTYYSLFALTWNPDNKLYVLGRWRIVSDLNNKI